MGERLYGAKCHICACLRHDGEQASEPIPWLPKPPDRLLWCPDCDSCQEDALSALIFKFGLDLFDAETRAAVEAFRRGDDHPTLDSLRAECQAIDAELGTTPNGRRENDGGAAAIDRLIDAEEADHG